MTNSEDKLHLKHKTMQYQVESGVGGRQELPLELFLGAHGIGQGGSRQTGSHVVNGVNPRL